ncbi:MAG: sulfurtransferase [Sandaracinaceae bacterium]
MRTDPLISTAELAAALEGPEAPSLVFVDARSGPTARVSFERAHLRGARWVDLETELAGPHPDPARGGRHPLPAPEAFATTLTRLGVGPKSRVVVYDDQGGANAAARLWWMLRAFEHPRVRVLDGGWAAIEEAAARGVLALASGPEADASGPAHPVRAWIGDEADAGDVLRLREDPRWLVIDVRAPARYRGEVEPIDPIAGHIPGAVNVPFSENLDPSGRFLDAAALRAKYEALLAGRPAERAIVHCGSGVTACHTLLALERAGLTGALLYVGSWSEWCRRPELPRAPR